MALSGDETPCSDFRGATVRLRTDLGEAGCAISRVFDMGGNRRMIVSNGLPSTGMISIIVLTLMLSGCTSRAVDSSNTSMNARRFRFKGFVICAWFGPDATDAEIKAYKDGAFNSVMVGRYMSKDKFCYPDEVQENLDLAHKHGLGAFLDTCTMNELVWGGVVTKPDDQNGAI